MQRNGNAQDYAMHGLDAPEKIHEAEYTGDNDRFVLVNTPGFNAKKSNIIRLSKDCWRLLRICTSIISGHRSRWRSYQQMNLFATFAKGVEVMAAKYYRKRRIGTAKHVANSLACHAYLP